MSPITYPAMTVTFMTEGIKKHWNTHAPVERTWNETTHRYDDYYGEQDGAVISITLWSEDEDELRILAESLYKQLRLRRLDLDWCEDQIKLTNVKGVQWLEPYADEFAQEHTWRAVIDFEVEYLWKELEVMPAIRSFEYLFNVGEDEDIAPNETLYTVQDGSYLMGINMKGWRVPYNMDALILKGTVSETYGMDIVIV
jgi:hypothetical protein